LALGTLLALTLSVAMAFILEFTNPSFRTPHEVFSELNIPVLAAVPHKSYGFADNGNGSKNGNSSGTGSDNSNGNEVEYPVFAGHDPSTN
jgi:hypothetical protein